MPKLKVLDINNLYSPTGGGIRVYHSEKLKWCRNNNIENLLLFPSSNDVLLENGAVRGIKSPKLGKSGYNFFVNGNSIREIVKQFKPDFIELGSGIVVPSMIKKLNNIPPLFAYFHSNWPETLPMSLFGVNNKRITDLFQKLTNPFLRRAYNSVNYVFAASNYSFQKLKDAGISKITKVPLGVDSKIFNQNKRSRVLRKKLGVGNNQKMVLYMGRLAPEKGIHVLMNSSKYLLKNKEIILVIAGFGHWKKQVKKMASDNPSRVVFLDKIHSREETAELMASADAFISAGPFETFSLTTLEALSCGTPVVACKQAASSELVLNADGKSIYEPWDSPVSLANSIQKAVVSSQNDRNNYSNFAKQYTWDSSFEKIFQKYKEFI